MATSKIPTPPILSGRFSPRIARFFARYTRRLFARKFASVRVEPAGWPLLESLDSHIGPAIIVLNHASWWDPLLCALVALTACPSRSACGAMERTQLEKFSFFRRLGLFGVDPDDPNTLAPMLDYVHRNFASNPKATFWLTPQGEFADPRRAIQVRPGAAAIAARAERVWPGRLRVVSIAAEYTFGLEQRPDLLLRIQDVQPLRADGSPALRTGIGGWQRGITAAMQHNQDALAALVTARSLAPFRTLLGGRSSINPIYDFWLRLRGQSTALDTRRRSN